MISLRFVIAGNLLGSKQNTPIEMDPLIELMPFISYFSSIISTSLHISHPIFKHFRNLSLFYESTCSYSTCHRPHIINSANSFFFVIKTTPSVVFHLQINRIFAREQWNYNLSTTCDRTFFTYFSPIKIILQRARKTFTVVTMMNLVIYR